MSRVDTASKLESTTRVVPEAGDPLVHLGADGFAWLHGKYGFVASGIAARVALDRGPGRIERAAKLVEELLGSVATKDPLKLPGTGPIAVAAIPFDDDAAGEIVVPRTVVARSRSGAGWVTTIAAPGEGDWHRDGNEDVSEEVPSFGIDLRVDTSREEWNCAVLAALDRIGSGDLAKVVLAREADVELDRPIDRGALLDRLRQTYPSCFTFAAGSFVGSSPELLVRRRGVRVLSRPMAGTVERVPSAGFASDASALLSSPKETAEHEVVVDAVRNALEPVCSNLLARRAPEVVQLNNVAHLATTVGGWLNCPAPTALGLAGLLHPTPAVGGAPRRAALEAIAELETFDRGLYAGPVGWVDSRGNGEWAVAIRCARLDGRRARLSAGAGIVAASDPADEWAETEAKLQAMRQALESLA